MKRIRQIVMLALLMPWAGHAVGQAMDLHGDWAFQLDEKRVGLRERWFNKELADTIKLPGSTDEAGFGTKSQPDPVRLTREYRYVGPAWYQKTIEIPDSWRGKRVELFLERAMWETRVWIDDHYLGMQDSLCVPHRFDLSDFLTPGTHRLTLRIDNRLKINVGHEPNGDPQRGGWSRMWAMSLTEESQGNWNGVIGRIELRATDPVWVERVEAHPDIDKKDTRVTAWVRSRVGAVSGELKVSATCGDHTMAPVTAVFRTMDDAERSARDDLAPKLGDLGGVYYERRALTRIDLVLPFGKGARLWDEFAPNVYQLKVELSGKGGGGEIYRDVYQDTFGLRKFTADGKQLKLNGRTVFLRGNQDNCIHSKTAYPPMTKAEWLAFWQKHKDHGLNNMRFHSWCPPKAAFEAADELGMFVHVEGPLWEGSGNVGHLPDRANFIRSESERILDEYGNHPSFVMMAPGNELGIGRELYLQHLVEVWRARDKRHLYTSNCHPFNPRGIDDFFVSPGGIGGPARGLAQANGKAYFTFEETVSPFDRPFISHEIGQYTSFPDLYGWFNAEKYTGPLKAHYIDLIRKRFERFHPAERGPKYAAASGALQVLQYKTELEAMLRTPSMDGYHLNGLMDYPGEGIALIGMLDAMGDSKGLITPEHFRRFCAPTVALVTMSEDELPGGSLFKAEAMVRHHGPRDLEGSRWHWSIKDRAGKPLFEGELGPHRVPTGGLTGLGKIEVKLPDVSQARELILSLRMTDSEVMNEWSFWVFPGGADVAVPESVTLVKSWTEDARAALENGGSVVVTLNAGSLVDPVPCSFGTVFWGRGLFPRNPRPMGILCDPAQGALAGFPTRSHAQYQWYSLLTGSAAMKLNKLPFEFEPVVHMIDDFNECERLGLVLEAKVGKGRLIATSLNLGEDGERTLAQKEMLRSLLARAASAKAASPQSLTLDQLDTVFRAPRVSQLKRLGGRIAAVSSENPGMEQAHMIDGDPQTFWHTRFAGSFAKPPHFVVLEVPAGTSVAGLTYVAYTGGNGNGHVKACAVYTSDDGKNWGTPLIQKALKAGVDADQKIMFPAPTTRKFIKFEATDAVSAGGEPIAAIGELDVLLQDESEGHASAFEMPYATDEYGGNMEIRRKATGFFRIEEVNGRLLLITPKGHGYVALGANHVGEYLEGQSNKMGFLAKHGNDMDRGAQGLLKMMKGLGLNAGGSFGEEPRHERALPRVARLYYARGTDRLGPAGLGPDVFDEKELEKLREFIIKEVRKYADNPWIIGISASNIPPWDGRRMKRVRAAKPGSPMRQHYRDFIKSRYADISAYNRAYGDELESFEQLSSEKKLKAFPLNENTRTDNDAFLAIIADRLYGTVRAAIKAGAPNHLFLGESVIFRNLPDPVLKAIGPHIDAYSAQVIMRSYGARILKDSPDQPPHWQVFDRTAFDHVHKLTGKPIVIDDWVASFSLGETFDTGTECGTFFDEILASQQASDWLISAFEQPYILGVFKCQLIGLHGADLAFDGKSRRTYYQDDGSPFRFRTEITREAHRKAFQAAYAAAQEN